MRVEERPDPPHPREARPGMAVMYVHLPIPTPCDRRWRGERVQLREASDDGAIEFMRDIWAGLHVTRTHTAPDRPSITSSEGYTDNSLARTLRGSTEIAMCSATLKMRRSLSSISNCTRCLSRRSGSFRARRAD